MWITRVALIAVAMLLAACATGPRIVGSQVSTVTAAPPGAAILQEPHYRFEPAPEVVGGPSQHKLQAMAAVALERIGAVQDDVAPRVGVQVGGRVSAYWRSDPYGGMSNTRMALYLGSGWRGGGLGWGLGWPFWDSSIPAYASEVSLVMRDLHSGQIVYSTQARHDGPWHDTDAVLAALFVAALQGYPDPPPGVRRVDVPLHPAGSAATAPAPQPVAAPPR